MSLKLTKEQSEAILSRGKVIVSASAGSGKTFVMIQKIADLIEEGGDLDEILAVTFTKKAAAQMKEKLRSALIERLSDATGEKRVNLKSQLGKIPAADISTIHSLCSHLIRTYFYALDVDSSFDIMSDDAQGEALTKCALDSLFDRLYEEENTDLLRLLSVLRRKRSDDGLKFLISQAYSDVRNNPDYVEFLEGMEGLYTQDGFQSVCLEYHSFAAEKAAACLASVDEFRKNFKIGANADKYARIFEEMREAFKSVIDNNDIFADKKPFALTRKPTDSKDDKEAGKAFSDFKDNLKGKYDKLYGDLEDRETEFLRFMSAGKTAVSFARILLQFDEEYTRVKREEGKLDYSDLEHLTLKLLKDGEIKARINARYRHVFVDEYQDVNPVQERIINEVAGGEVFTVGDVKQAIYGFRGSKSLFFAQKYNRLLGGGGTALRLSSNFRSADAVINFVNGLFSDVMTENVCGFSYKNNSEMVFGGAYPEGYGSAQFCVFGKDDVAKEEPQGVYSVKEHSNPKTGHTREGLAVLKIVERELSGKHYDLKKKAYVDTLPGDICILTRKRAGKSVAGIVRALTDAGYAVAGAKQADICQEKEVREMIDILSYIDNSQQDIPLVTCLLSPLGGLDEEELAHIRIYAQQRFRGERPAFRECALVYATSESDPLAYKLAAFFKKIYNFRKLTDILGAAAIIDRICEECGYTALYAAGNGERLASIRRLSQEAFSPSGELSLNAFLAKIRSGGLRIPAPSNCSSDSIKIMTMHASKGLEFPVVIIADCAASFKGMDYSDMPYDDYYGFAPKFYDSDKKLCAKTLLRSLCSMRAAREDLKNELNLFYVACTRAMCSLYIMSSEVRPYDKADVLNADCYAEVCDISRYSPVYMSELNEIEGDCGREKIIGEADKTVYAEIKRLFNKPYERAESVELPVKSSASKLIKMEGDYFAENALYPREEENAGQTGAERGTAYHRYLELCDFTLRDGESIAAQIDGFVKDGLMTKEQASLLDLDKLIGIVNMSVFKELDGSTLYREREFLCRLPANAFLDTGADDKVLIQGAIDLLAVGRGGTAIIDYKYSKKSDEQLIETYSRQLALYKKAVAAILGVGENKIKTTIVNIFSRREISLDL